MTNEEVIIGLRTGNPKAFIWLDKTCRGKCVGYLLHEVMNEVNDENKDMAQALFGEALVAMTKNVRSGGLTLLEYQPVTYLTTIMRRKFFKGLEAKRLPLVLDNPEVIAKLEKEALDNSIQETIGDEDLQKAIRRYILRNIAKLGPKCRELITLHYLDGLITDEILPLLDKSYTPSALRMQMMRCRTALAKIMREDKSKPNDDDA